MALSPSKIGGANTVLALPVPRALCNVVAIVVVMTASSRSSVFQQRTVAAVGAPASHVGTCSSPVTTYLTAPPDCNNITHCGIVKYEEKIVSI